MSIKRWEDDYFRYEGDQMREDPEGKYVLWDDVVSHIRTMLDNREATYADGTTEHLCSDWCVDKALSALLDQLGEPDDDVSP